MYEVIVGTTEVPIPRAWADQQVEGCAMLTEKAGSNLSTHLSDGVHWILFPTVYSKGDSSLGGLGLCLSLGTACLVCTKSWVQYPSTE